MRRSGVIVPAGRLGRTHVAFTETPRPLRMPLGLGVGSAADALTSLTRASHWVFAADTDSTYAEFGARGAKIVEET